MGHKEMTYCEGCRTRERNCTMRVYLEYATEEKALTVGKCPCGICLIKGICTVACEDYLSFSIIEY